MRKRTKRRAVQPRAPMLVVMHVMPELSITERMSVEAFAGGWATSDHYDNLADCRNILMLAAADSNDQNAIRMAEVGYIALSNIKDRKSATGKFGTTGDELAALRAMADFSEDWWRRQSGARFHDAYDALSRAHGGAAK